MTIKESAKATTSKSAIHLSSKSASSKKTAPLKGSGKGNTMRH